MRTSGEKVSISDETEHVISSYKIIFGVTYIILCL